MKIKKMYFICRGYIHFDTLVSNSVLEEVSREFPGQALSPNTWIEVTREPDLRISKVYSDGVYKDVCIPLSYSKLIDLFLNFQIKTTEACPKGGKHECVSGVEDQGRKFVRCSKCLI